MRCLRLPCTIPYLRTVYGSHKGRNGPRLFLTKSSTKLATERFRSRKSLFLRIFLTAPFGWLEQGPRSRCAGARGTKSKTMASWYVCVLRCVLCVRATVVGWGSFPSLGIGGVPPHPQPSSCIPGIPSSTRYPCT